MLLAGAGLGDAYSGGLSSYGALLLASLARDPQLAPLTTMQLLALSTLDGAKREALQQRELF